ncbi:MAG TPA: hypothetical protein P5530_03605 [Candidatus Diapherotrites archaeon]|nr:hypothetical protein [Candidatus Diapherotrites archaeon]
MNLKLNQKGDDSASEAYRLLIGFILGAAILVIIMNMINSTQNQLIIVSNQKLKEGLISAVKSTGTSAKTPFVIEDLMLKGNISKTTITNYTGLPEECMAFVAGPKLFSVNDYNVLRIKTRHLKMNVWAYCNFMPSGSNQLPDALSPDTKLQLTQDRSVCPTYCVFFFNIKPPEGLYTSNP